MCRERAQEPGPWVNREALEVLRCDEGAKEYVSLFRTKVTLRTEPSVMNFIKGQKHELKTPKELIKSWEKEPSLPRGQEKACPIEVVLSNTEKTWNMEPEDFGENSIEEKEEEEEGEGEEEKEG